jgi:hypothetical protein
MKLRWDKLGGLLGILYCVVGALLIFLGWNGTASYDRVSAQIPYVVSGGIAGLALVVLGSALLIAQSHRGDRAALQATLEELRDALGRVAAAEEVAAVAQSGSVESGVVLAGPNSYHRPDCRLVVGQAGLTPMDVAAAREQKLEPCRICTP